MNSTPLKPKRYTRVTLRKFNLFKRKTLRKTDKISDQVRELKFQLAEQFEMLQSITLKLRNVTDVEAVQIALDLYSLKYGADWHHA